jgi:hypothetical protein
MFGCALGLVTLALQLKEEFPEVEHPWYADDAEAAAHFKHIHQMCERLE